jgi:hypothetical protein
MFNWVTIVGRNYSATKNYFGNYVVTNSVTSSQLGNW